MAFLDDDADNYGGNDNDHDNDENENDENEIMVMIMMRMRMMQMAGQPFFLYFGKCPPCTPLLPETLTGFASRNASYEYHTLATTTRARNTANQREKYCKTVREIQRG